METTIIQVPVSKVLRKQAVKAALENGFSSLQDAIRVFLSQFAERKIDITFEHAPVKLSKKNDKRYAKIIEDVESGRVKTKSFTNINDMMNYLNK